MNPTSQYGKTSDDQRQVLTARCAVPTSQYGKTSDDQRQVLTARSQHLSMERRVVIRDRYLPRNPNISVWKDV